MGNTIIINNKKLFKNSLSLVLTVAAVIFLLIIFFNSWFTVDEQQQAVVTTFGEATRVCEAGMHFKVPFIQKVHKVNVNVLQKLELGYRTDAFGDYSKSFEEESKMITGDYNIVNIDFFYRV